MSKIWSFIFVFSILVAMFSGNVDVVLSSIMESGKSSIENVIGLAGMMCFWSGIFKILSETKVIKKFSHALSKILYFLFDKKQLNEKAIEYMSLNIASNILGVGNAATLNGIKAVQELQKENPKKDEPSDNMTTFILINMASLQLIPTSMIALRAMYGSQNPSSIIVAVWVASTIALIVGLCSIKFLNKRRIYVL